MGAMQRRKGHDFERDIARRLRARWPHLTVRRSQQGDKAYEPDVVVEGVPLWLECQCAAKPAPLAKLEQAERDVERFAERPHPIVVWRKSGERTTRVTMATGTLLETCGWSGWESSSPSEAHASVAVTLDFELWLAAVNLEWVCR